MTKHLAIEVTNKYESELVQRALFDMGFKWDGGDGVRNTSATLIFPYYVRDWALNFDHCGGIVCCGKFINIEKCKLCDLCPMGYPKYDGYLLISAHEFFKTYAYHIENFPDYEPKDLICDNLGEHVGECQEYVQHLIDTGEMELKVPFMELKPKQENKQMTNKIEKFNIIYDASLTPYGEAWQELHIKINEIIDAIDAIDEWQNILASKIVNVDIRLGNLDKEKYQSFKSDNPVPDKMEVKFFEFDGMTMAMPPPQTPQQILEDQLSKLEKGCWYLVKFKIDGELVTHLAEYKECNDEVIFSLTLCLEGENKGSVVTNYRVDKDLIKPIQKLDV